jgi:hypothetical protein
VALMALVVGLMSPSLAAAADACGRDCLRKSLDAYLAAVFKHDPTAAPLAAGHRATENARDVAVGEGFWKTFSAYGDVQRRYFDPVTGNAAYFGHLKETGKDTIVSVRVRVAAGRITEAEWTTAREGNFGMFEPAGLSAHPPLPDAPLPQAERSSRFTLISIANGYFQGLQDHDGEWIPHYDTCERVENGVRVTFRPRRAGPPGGAAPATPVSSAPAAPATTAGAPTCVAGFEMFRNSIAEATMRRFPLVDEEAGVVMGATIFRRPAGSTTRRNLLTEYFYVRNGRLNGIWAAMYYLDPAAPFSSGWENR